MTGKPFAVAGVMSMFPTLVGASTLRFIDPSPNLRTYLRASTGDEEIHLKTKLETEIAKIETGRFEAQQDTTTLEDATVNSEIDPENIDFIPQSDPIPSAEVEELVAQKEAVKIGEDCSSDDTACKYFRPSEFVDNNMLFMDEVSQIWGLNSINQFCEVALPWAVEMFGFDCNEEGVDDSSKYCRPANMQNVDLDPSLAYWHLPMSFTFKHVRKAGGNSFLRAMWNIDDNEEPNFQVTKIRASIDEDAAHMAEERMDAVARDQGEGKVHPLFLTVRNPVSRFVSSVSQVLGDVAEVEEACWSDNGSDVLRCVLGLVEGGLNNIHTIPMFADIYCNVKGRNVEVSMYDLKDMAGVLKALGLEDEEKANPSKFKLSVADLDDDMVRRICSLYAWDVSMMEQAGFEVPECRMV